MHLGGLRIVESEYAPKPHPKPYPGRKGPYYRNVPAAVRRLSDQVPKMNDAEFARLVVEVGCMADDGIEPSYLLQAAKRYKVDAQKIRQEMEAEFKRQDQAQKQPDKKEAPQASAPAKPKPTGKKATPPKKAKAKK